MGVRAFSPPRPLGHQAMLGGCRRGGGHGCRRADDVARSLRFSIASGSGQYLRRIDFLYHSTLDSRVMQKMVWARLWCSLPSRLDSLGFGFVAGPEVGLRRMAPETHGSALGGRYRGSSHIRNSHPHGTIIGPQAWSYCRVLDGRCFLRARYPCARPRLKQA